VTDPAEPESYSLVMPFVPVASNGGPYDDLAYAAGWEMGALDAALRLKGPVTTTLAVRAANGAQAELIAMRHGYRTRIAPHDDHWSMLWLHRVSADETGMDTRDEGLLRRWTRPD
jgi:hypothetical protein